MLERASEIVESELPPKLGKKIRGHMNVRRRAGKPCPRPSRQPPQGELR
jgi:hypothetical protein